MIEYGPLESNPDILVPATRLTNFPADMYNYTSIPQPGMNNQTAVIRGGALVGGGSAVNSMFFDRGSVQNYDNVCKFPEQFISLSGYFASLKAPPVVPGFPRHSR